MQAPGDGSAVGARGRVGQQSSGTPGCQSGTGSPEGEGGPRHPEARRGPSRGGAATGAAAAGPQSGREPRALRAGGDAALAAVGPGSRRLVFTWTAEDLVLCRISISFFRDQLSLVIQNIQRPGPPPP